MKTRSNKILTGALVLFFMTSVRVANLKAQNTAIDVASVHTENPGQVFRL